MADRVITELPAMPKPVTFHDAEKNVHKVAAYARASMTKEDQETSLAALPDGVTFGKNCGAEVTQNLGRKRKRFCCDKGRNEWWNRHQHLVNRKEMYKFKCQNCGKIFYAYGNKKRKYCCHECYVQHRFRMEPKKENIAAMSVTY